MQQLKVKENNIVYPKSLLVEPAQFRIAAINDDKCSLASYNRRDFFKISLITTGSSRLMYANKDIEINRPALVFTNPMVPYSWEPVGDADIATGYFCVFKDSFLQNGGRMESLQESTLFKGSGNPVYLLDDAQVAYIGDIFSRMRQEFDTEYVYKNELLRNMVNLIIHEAIKMQPAVAHAAPANAAARITQLFLTLLERQFPVESPQHVFALKKASDYADKLAIHVNHLNAAVQEITGKSTTAHINEKVLTEAKLLLTHTNWSVAEIAFSLCFEYPSYFNNFIKKHTGSTPMALRRNL